jgi:preprotein translocase subunit SecA
MKTPAAKCPVAAGRTDCTRPSRPRKASRSRAKPRPYATITIQNYFRLYQKLGGMTGTAETEAAEFHDIYKLEVLVIPTNRPIARKDQNDKIYKTRARNSRPSSISSRSATSRAAHPPRHRQRRILRNAFAHARREKITHSVLNAKFHLQEAEIVARAGQQGAVTVATNMAGRGTDIKLGEGVADRGGLFVIGTERHRSRRVDRQLRGRCSRQGDPGRSVFYVSFEDDLMMQFGAAERMTKMMERFGLEEGRNSSTPGSTNPSKTPRRRSKRATTSPGNTSSNTTTS